MTEETKKKEESLALYYVISFLIPLVGIIMGLMKLNDGDKGQKILLFSIAMIFVNIFLFSIMTGLLIG